MEGTKAYFIGIGGIGMSALAQMLADHGATVLGSDREASRVTEMLEAKGVRVIIGQKGANIPADATVVIYSDAVPKEHPERLRASELGIPQHSYFHMLGEVSQDKKTVAVAGTHGKTTTTGMLAKILRDAGASPTAIVGSIVKDFNSNYLRPSTPLGAGGKDLFVVEACEYRDHLLELAPEVLVITNLEWDHTDWFPSLAALQETFRKAIAKVPAQGRVVTNPHNPNIAPLLESARAQVIDYTREPAYELKLIGEFNQMNARAAAAAARVLLPSIADSLIGQSLASFEGTWRRFEYKGKTVHGADVYDDYAHHPTAVRETLTAARAKTQGKIYAAFHPHLYSRTRDLFEEFSRAFADADTVFIAPIYAAREVDDGTVSHTLLADRVNQSVSPPAGGAHALDSFDAIEQAFGDAGPGDLVITMGAGDIYKVADALVQNSL